ncbi:YbaK/EbsC family protein [Hahella chejuensis]|nr:YbaK/EbsC family protein [Hahella chejuensis]
MRTLNDLYRDTMALLQKANVNYREETHEPVFTYEKAEEVARRLGFTGAESKSLFMKLKDGRFCMLVTLQHQRLDWKQLKNALGGKASFCSDEELKERTGCEPMCACPFGHPADITLVIDECVFASEKLVFSPGPPEKTVEISVEDVRKVLDCCDNPVVYLAEREME